MRKTITTYCGECGATHPYNNTDFPIYGRCECSAIPTMRVMDLVDLVQDMDRRRIRLISKMHELMDVTMTKDTLRNFPKVVDDWVAAQGRRRRCW